MHFEIGVGTKGFVVDWLEHVLHNAAKEIAMIDVESIFNEELKEFIASLDLEHSAKSRCNEVLEQIADGDYDDDIRCSDMEDFGLWLDDWMEYMHITDPFDKTASAKAINMAAEKLQPVMQRYYEQENKWWNERLVDGDMPDDAHDDYMQLTQAEWEKAKVEIRNLIEDE